MEFSGRHVAITGATGALGGATLQYLLALGANCHVSCRDARSLERVTWSAS